jgi:hypothetical protein
MRRLIRRWLGLEDHDTKVSASGWMGNDAIGGRRTVFVQLIRNGFLVTYGDGMTYCKELEELPGLVASAFALDKLASQQLDLFGYQHADAVLFNRPINQPHV